MDDIQTICRNSFRNFHAKGVDYLCLSRSDELTIKAYFFEGDLSKLPEIVMPHNHRYGFMTAVLAGMVVNKEYAETEDPEDTVFNRFDFYTPLNGWDKGFMWSAETRLTGIDIKAYGPGQFYMTPADAIHTLDIKSEQACVVIYQFEDVLHWEAPSQAFQLGDSKAGPSLDGLYDDMRPDHAIRRLGQLHGLGFPNLEMIFPK